MWVRSPEHGGRQSLLAVPGNKADLRLNHSCGTYVEMKQRPEVSYTAGVFSVKSKVRVGRRGGGRCPEGIQAVGIQGGWRQMASKLKAQNVWRAGGQKVNRRRGSQRPEHLCPPSSACVEDLSLRGEDLSLRGTT